MIKILLFLLPLSLIFAFSCKEKTNNNDKADDKNQKTDVSGILKKFPDFKSKYVDPRNVDIWLPPSYDAKGSKKYPVLYMHDGQVLFETGRGFTGKEWEVDEMMTRLIKEKKIREAIVVGIWNTPKRFLEYAPEKPFLKLLPEEQMLTDSLKNAYGGSPLADSYLKFIAEELKPYMDTHYKTLPGRANTFMLGSSMGGLITIYALAEYPDIFSDVACLSTHFPILLNDNNPMIANLIIRWLKTNLPKGDGHKVYFDYGTETLDAWYEPHQLRMDSVMQDIGYERGVNWITRKFEGAEHSEVAWKERLDIPLVFLLGFRG